MSCTVEIRGSAKDLLHEIVAEGLAAFRAKDLELPDSVMRELKAFLACGDPTHGFAWLHCASCDHHRLVPFCCKGRGFCPGCCGRRMADRAAWWSERVFPRVPTRQWVLTIPWKRRLLLARNSDLAMGVLGVALKLIERWYRKQTNAPTGRGGSVTAIQRFGSSLNLNLHFHVLALDGVYVRDSKGLHFRRGCPETADVEALVVGIAERCEAWLARRGFGAEEEMDSEGDDGLALLQEASVGGYIAVGPRSKRKVRRVQILGGQTYPLPKRTASCDGYNLNAGVAVKAEDRAGLERLSRYILRPPLAKGRIERLPDGTVRLGMKRAWSDGTIAVEFSAMEFVEKLAAILPPPRRNQVIYRGVLAGNSKWRREIVPRPIPKPEEKPSKKLTPMPKLNLDVPRKPWADLLAHVFGIDAFLCPNCGGRMELRCVVQGRATPKVLEGLERSRGPP